MNLYNMLPFLEGWEFLYLSETKTVEKGVKRNIYSEHVKGWLFGVSFLTDDAHSFVEITYLGVRAAVSPYACFATATVQWEPFSPYCPLYLQPSTLSTAGIFGASFIEIPEVYSVKGLVTVNAGLGASSTQTSSSITVVIVAIKIVDEKAFIKSVRKALYGKLSTLFDVLSHVPVLKHIGVPEEVEKVME